MANIKAPGDVIETLNALRILTKWQEELIDAALRKASPKTARRRKPADRSGGKRRK